MSRKGRIFCDAGLIAIKIGLRNLAEYAGRAMLAILPVMGDAAGSALSAGAGTETIAAVGAGLTGTGYSLIVPGHGRVAVRMAPTDTHGGAMGANTAYLDPARGASDPVLSCTATAFGGGTTFVASAIEVTCEAIVAFVWLMAVGPAWDMAGKAILEHRR